jgi:hypothetical protein
MNHLANFIDGFAGILKHYLAPARPYRRPSCGGGFILDQSELRADVCRVSADIQKSVSVYGYQGSSGKSEDPYR